MRIATPVSTSAAFLRRGAGRLAGHAANHLRAGHQLQDRKDARTRCARYQCKCESTKSSNNASLLLWNGISSLKPRGPDGVVCCPSIGENALCTRARGMREPGWE